MKYHGFDSPLDWSQYLIQKADKHEYEPSEPGKRVEALLEKQHVHFSQAIFAISSIICIRYV